MGAEPARRADHRERARHPDPRRALRSRAPDRGDRATKLERRRRERHFRRRRRDLLEDTGLALLLTIALVTVTAGLGVLALIEVPVTTALIAWLLAERAIKKRRGRHSRTSRRVRR
ncbi:MAG TPA: hypothetical protein VIL82_09130 [Solirubrobacteraceae bacterium]|jgi:hypothetical protein